MGIISSAARNKLPKSDFALPASKKYPMPDKAHAINAKARATQQVDKGNMSVSTASKIKAKANTVIGKKR